MVLFIALLFSLGEFALVWAMLFAVIVTEKIILIIFAGVFKVFNQDPRVPRRAGGR